MRKMHGQTTLKFLKCLSSLRIISSRGSESEVDQEGGRVLTVWKHRRRRGHSVPVSIPVCWDLDLHYTVFYICMYHTCVKSIPICVKFDCASSFGTQQFLKLRNVCSWRKSNTSYKMCKNHRCPVTHYVSPSDWKVKKNYPRPSLSIVKPIDAPMYQICFIFGMTLWMFRTVFPSIIRSSRMYIQQQAYVKQTLLTDC